MNKKRKAPASLSAESGKSKSKLSHAKPPSKVTKAKTKSAPAKKAESQSKPGNGGKKSTPAKSVSKSPQSSTSPVPLQTKNATKSTVTPVKKSPKKKSVVSLAKNSNASGSGAELHSKTPPKVIKSKKSTVKSGQKRGRKPKTPPEKVVVEVKERTSEDEPAVPAQTPKRGRPRLRPLDSDAAGLPTLSATSNKKEAKKPESKKVEVKKETVKKDGTGSSPIKVQQPSTSAASKPSTPSNSKSIMVTSPSKFASSKKVVKSKSPSKKVLKAPAAKKAKPSPKVLLKKVVKTETRYHSPSPPSLSESSSLDSFSSESFSAPSSVNSRSTTSSNESNVDKKVTLKKKVAQLVKKAKKVPPSKLIKVLPSKKSSAGEKAKKASTLTTDPKSLSSSKKQSSSQKKDVDSLISAKETTRGRPKSAAGNKKKLAGTKKKKPVLPKRAIKKPRQASLNASAINRLLTESISSAAAASVAVITTSLTTPTPTMSATTPTTTPTTTASTSKVVEPKLEKEKKEPEEKKVKSKKKKVIKHDPNERSLSSQPSTSSVKATFHKSDEKSKIKKTKKTTLVSKTKVSTSSSSSIKSLSKKKSKEEEKGVKKKDNKKDKNVITKGKKGKKKSVKRNRNLLNTSLGDRTVEIIDTRRCKRMASLNASAMMAATYLPETRLVVRRPDAEMQTVRSDPLPTSLHSNGTTSSTTTTTTTNFDYRTSHIVETIDSVVRHWPYHLDADDDHGTLGGEDATTETQTQKTTVTTTVKRVKLRGSDTVLETISTEYAQQANFRQPTAAEVIGHHQSGGGGGVVAPHHPMLPPPVVVPVAAPSSSSAFTPCSASSTASSLHHQHHQHIGLSAPNSNHASSPSVHQTSTSISVGATSTGNNQHTGHQSSTTKISSKRAPSGSSSSRSRRKQQVAAAESSSIRMEVQRIQVESSSSSNSANAHNSLHNSLLAANTATIFAAAAANNAAAAAANVHHANPIITNFTPGALFANHPYISHQLNLQQQQQQQQLLQQQQATTPFNFFLQTPNTVQAAAAAAAAAAFPSVATVNPFNPHLNLINLINGGALFYQTALAQQQNAAAANAFGGLQQLLPTAAAPQLMHFGNASAGLQPTQAASASTALFPFGLINQQQQQQQLLRTNQIDQQLPFLRLQSFQPSATVSTVPSASITSSLVHPTTVNHQNLLHQQQQQHHHQLGTPAGIIHRPVAYHAQTGQLSTTTNSPAILTHHQPLQNASIFSGNAATPLFGRVHQLPAPTTVAQQQQTFQLPMGTTIVGGNGVLPAGAVNLPTAAATTTYSTIPQPAFLTQGTGGQIVQQTQQPQQSTHLLNFSNQSIQPRALAVADQQQQPQQLTQNGQLIGNVIQRPQLLIGPAGAATTTISNGTKRSKQKGSQSNGKSKDSSLLKRRNGHQQLILPAPPTANANSGVTAASHIHQLASLTQNLGAQRGVALNPLMQQQQQSDRTNKTAGKRPNNNNKKTASLTAPGSLKRKLIVPNSNAEGPKNGIVNGKTTAALVMVNGTAHPNQQTVLGKSDKTVALAKNTAAVLSLPNGLVATVQPSIAATLPPSAAAKRPRLARPAARAAPLSMQQQHTNGSKKPQPKVSIMLKKVNRSRSNIAASLRPLNGNSGLNGSINSSRGRSRTKSPSPNSGRRSKSPSVGGAAGGQSAVGSSSPANSENSTNSSSGLTPPKMVSPGRGYSKRKNNQQQTHGKIQHGWVWQGEPVERLVYLDNEDTPVKRKCYQSMKHKEGDTIAVRDCVLLKSGPNSDDIPYLAKITALWEKDGEMMMSLLWYYRPEYGPTSSSNGGSAASSGDGVTVSSTETEKTATAQAFTNCEVFASKHRDINSVACIDDKCHVLTYNEFCRFKRERARVLAGLPPSAVASERLVAPWQPSSIAAAEADAEGSQNSTPSTLVTSSSSSSSVPGCRPLPPLTVSLEQVFFCRKAYDFRQKRILKNPIPFSYRSSANLSE